MTVETSTDCRDDTGITVGLIDGLIAIVRVLVQRDLTAPEVVEALKDQDVAKLANPPQYIEEFLP
jgi:hypothetical protein